MNNSYKWDKSHTQIIWLPFWLLWRGVLILLKSWCSILVSIRYFEDRSLEVKKFNRNLLGKGHLFIGNYPLIRVRTHQAWVGSIDPFQITTANRIYILLLPEHRIIVLLLLLLSSYPIDHVLDWVVFFVLEEKAITVHLLKIFQLFLTATISLLLPFPTLNGTGFIIF